MWEEGKRVGPKWEWGIVFGTPPPRPSPGTGRDQEARPGPKVGKPSSSAPGVLATPAARPLPAITPPQASLSKLATYYLPARAADIRSDLGV